jgi:tetratricopeptide (TPR) repeat protein
MRMRLQPREERLVRTLGEAAGMFAALLACVACTMEPSRPDAEDVSKRINFSDAEYQLANCQCNYAEMVDGSWVEAPVITVADEDMFVWKDQRGRHGAQSFAELTANYCAASEAALCFERKIKHYFMFKSTMERDRFLDAAVAYRAQQADALHRRQEAFASAVLTYQSASNKPHVGEDVRKFEAKGESAARENHFAEAQLDYGKALEIAPWWAEGHYNRALVMSESGAYRTAITELKRYLALRPNADNVADVQDRINEWEGKLAVETKATAPSTPQPQAKSMQ